MNDKGYINIQGWMINQLKLKGNELVLFALIFGFSQDGNSEFYGSIRYIEKALGISNPTVQKLLKKLLYKKLIHRTRESHYRGHNKVIHGVQESYTPSVQESYTNINNTNNNTNNNKASFSKESYFEEIWGLYSFKKGKKKARDKFIKIIEKEKEPLLLIKEIKQAIPKYKIELENKTWLQQQQLEFWLNGRRWEDEFETKKKSTKSNIIHSHSNKYMDVKVTKSEA